MYGAIISGTGSYLPEKILTNHDLEKIVETSDEWIKTRTGISERRIAGNGIITSDMAAAAAQQAMLTAGVSADKVDLIVLATVTPDMVFPATACIVQHKIGARAAAFDVNAACSGFVYALSVAEQYIKAGSAKNVLVIGAETYSTILDWTDRNTCVLFGDGAGAVLLTQSTDKSRGIISSRLYTDGSMSETICVPGGGAKYPCSLESIEKRLHYMKMKGNETFKVAVRSLTESAQTILQENNYTTADLDLFIPHQANSRIIQSVANYLSLPEEKLFCNIDKYGNTSAASIPIALDEAVAAGRLKPGNLLLVSAFGGGLTWGASLIRW
ncbi:MAG: ketoacyl-ACP synthase III [Candidatus Schekmanbacteria bacterium]|nr:ketoacyl-ACP synthase III [Candidatus Schekmanbacteria bacterium]